nr:protein FAM168A isoform X2 [Chrysemys picta bellii]
MPPRGLTVPGAWPAGSCSSPLVSNGPAGGTLPPSSRPVPSPTRWLLWEDRSRGGGRGGGGSRAATATDTGSGDAAAGETSHRLVHPQSSQSSTMNPVYSPVQPGAPYGNPKNMAYTGYPTGYPTAAPAYNPNMYPTSSPGYAPGKNNFSFWKQFTTCLRIQESFTHLPFVNWHMEPCCHHMFFSK